jgi:hypothetical protein
MTMLLSKICEHNRVVHRKQTPGESHTQNGQIKRSQGEMTDKEIATVVVVIEAEVDSRVGLKLR